MFRLFVCLLVGLLIVAGCVQDDEGVSEVVGGETAVSHYTTLIQQAPDSPWSWLSWARLEPVESE